MIQPNKFGVYSEHEPTAEVFELRLKRSFIRFVLLEVGPDKWAAAAHLEYGCGNHFGHGSPLSEPFYPSREVALAELQARAVRHFSPAGLHVHDSCVSSEQREHALHFTAQLEAGWPLNQFTFQPASERLYLFAAGFGIEPVGDLAGYELEADAMAALRAMKPLKGPNAALVCRGPYTREAFLSICERNGWQLVNGKAERIPISKRKSDEPTFCEGCGETLERCDCGRCEECGEPLESCECDDTVERELEPVVESEPVAVSPMVAEPEQLSLF